MTTRHRVILGDGSWLVKFGACQARTPDKRRATAFPLDEARRLAKMHSGAVVDPIAVDYRKVPPEDPLVDMKE